MRRNCSSRCLGASSYTFAVAKLQQRLPDWIEDQVRALEYTGGVSASIVCDNLKAAVAEALRFEPTQTTTFAAMAEHYDTTVLSTRPTEPRDKRKNEGAAPTAVGWIIARLHNCRFSFWQCSMQRSAICSSPQWRDDASRQPFAPRAVRQDRARSANGPVRYLIRIRRMEHRQGSSRLPRCRRPQLVSPPHRRASSAI